MRIGIISNTDSFIPLAYTLARNNLQVYTFYSKSPDQFVNQKVEGFIKATHIQQTIENEKSDLYKWIDETAPDIIFIIGYKYLIDLNKITKTKHLYNIHFGSLPSFRGPLPVFWQLKSGIPEIGYTIHQLSPKWDDGPIVWKKEVKNEPWYNYNYANLLFSQLCVEGAVNIVRCHLSNTVPTIIPVDGIPKRYQKRPVLEDTLIDWHTMNAEDICNLIRACNPWNKGALTFFNNNEVKLMDATIVSQDNATQTIPGTILDSEDQLLISCKENQSIKVNMLFLNDSYVPAYYAKFYGITKGKVFHEMKTNL